LLNKKPAAGLAARLVEEGDVRVPNIGTMVRVLSGGNQQKLLTQREIDIASRVLVAMHPTRGLDIAATEAVRRALIEHRNNGVAVLLISEDLDEIMTTADRIAVIYEGQITDSIDAIGANRDEIGMLMGGSKTAMRNRDD
jgi:simple sugar transport system ATP-binding protein